MATALILASLSPSYANFHQASGSWSVNGNPNTCTATKISSGTTLVIKLAKGFNPFNPNPTVLVYNSAFNLLRDGSLTLILTPSGSMLLQYHVLNKHTASISGFPTSLDTTKYTEFSVNFQGYTFTDSTSSIDSMKNTFEECIKQL